jgi:hypothetical protein
MATYHALLALLAMLALLTAPVLSRDSHWFSHILASGKIECFYEVLEKAVPVRVSSIVMDGGRRDIRLLVRHTVDESQIAAAEPRNVKVKTFVDTRETQHLDFVTEFSGEYSFCFDNRPVPPTTGLNVHAVPSDILDVKDALSSADKFLAFELHFRDSGEVAHQTGEAPGRSAKHLTEGKDAAPADIEQSKGINNLISQIRDKLDDVTSETNYYHFREEQNRNTAEAANTRVAWLTIMETFILLIVTACEIFLVRSWFAENSKQIRSRSWA